MRPWLAGLAVIGGVMAAFACLAKMAAVPEREDALVRFEPGPGYVVNDRAASYVRPELMRAVQHAAARVAREMGGAPVVLLDMSEADGAIPGTSRGLAEHPPGTHTGGRDIDVAYYRTGAGGDGVRPVCAVEVDGVDVHRCVGPPDRLDACRTALFITDLFEGPVAIRVVGVDGQVGPAIEACLDPRTRARVRLAYETEDTGRGWYRFHDSHMHVSLAP